MLKIGVLGAGHLEKYICVYYNNLKNMNWLDFTIQIKNADKIAKNLIQTF
jgi:hypothetical protein